ncbi:hypothetical protein CFP56_009286 [Quercus suber]|uniref:Uncharacterized protein n=1 Tax=Quercus suber TaxID=58331 RepID=A0AAW0L2W6_QUESU
MARRRAKKTFKKVESSPVNDGNDIIENEAQFDKEVERQSGAIRAIRDVEIEHLLTELRLLRSYFSKEQLQTPTMQFFKENLPNLSVVGTEGNKQFEVQWNDKESKVLEEPSETQILGMQDGLQTPGVSSQRLCWDDTQNIEAA